ncbi:MAG: hypothetical protein HRT99_04310 [Mycoplasmatales bacterium]|nr:hypothetical protein [Mycoplasmatales bacterium]
MDIKLSTQWSLGMAIGELVSSGLLVFFVMSIVLLSKNNSKNNRLFLTPIATSFLFGVLGAVAILMGIGVGNLISGNNNISGEDGLGLMSPNFALIQSLHWNSYQSLPMIIGFQLIGTFIGVLMYLLFAKMLINYKIGNYSYEDGFLLDDSNHKNFSLKSLLSQMLFVGMLVFITTLNEPTGSSSPMGYSFINNTIFLSIGLIILFVLFSKVGYFMLSPFVILPSIILAPFFGKKIKKALLNLTIETLIQFSFIGLFSGLDNYVRYFR